jgi:perosamine synthetase
VKTNNNFIPVFEPVFVGNERRYIIDCLKTGWISSKGQYIERFEKAFSRFCNAEYGVCCSSGTAALHLACEALGIGNGDEVIIPDFTIIVSANSVIFSGARPVLVDIEKKTWNIDPYKIEEKITKNTKAIMVVHMYGHPVDFDPILKIAKKHKLYIIEDCCQAHGAEYKGKKVGGIGDIGCFSFYANKVITTGEGGMLVTNSKRIYEKACCLRNQAFIEPRFMHTEIGFNYRLTNLQAAIGLAQLERIDYILEQKLRIARLYSKYLKNIKEIALPYQAKWAKNIYWMYSILIEDFFGMSRDMVMKNLRYRGIDTRAFFYPLHSQPVFRSGADKRFPSTKGSYPISDYVACRGLYLPSAINLTESKIKRICNQIISLIRRKKRVR